MSSKIFSLFAFGIFALVFAAGLASAAISLDPSTASINVNQGNSNSFTFTITNTDASSTYSSFTAVASDLIFGANTITSSNIVVGTLPSSLVAGNTSSAITVTITAPSTQPTGTYTGTITIDAAGSSTNPIPQDITLTVTVTSDTPSEITDCTDVGNPGDIKIKKIDFTNNGLSLDGKTFGKDDEWFPLENIEVQIDVKNQGSERVNNIEVNWGLWDTDANEWVIELVDEKDFDLKDGKTDTMTVSFKLGEDDLDVDLSDLSDGDHYVFYVTAQGEVDDASDTPTCAVDSEQVSIVIESDFVILDNIQIQETAQCGANVELTADVWNIGDRDQDDVSVQIYNADLNVNQKIKIGDIDAFDKKKLSFAFTAPKDIEEKTYALDVQVLDEDNDVFQNDYDDDDAEFIISLAIKGGCTGEASSVTVTANLVSGGQAGQDLVVMANLINTGSNSATYVLSSSGHGQWASTYDVQPSSLTLAAGQSGEATYTFKVNKDAFGEQTFYIELVSGTQVTRQPVSVTIEKAGFLSSITGGAIAENSLVWGLGLLNVILIIVIILVAIRVARK